MTTRSFMTMLFLISAGVSGFGETAPDPRMYYFIESIHSGKVMDVQSAKTSDGAAIIQYKRNNGFNQQILFVPSGTDGYYLMKVRSSGKYLTVSEGPAFQRSRTNGYFQEWRLTPEGDGFRITDMKGRDLTIKDGGRNDYARIVASDAQGVTGRTWKLMPALSGFEQSAMAAADLYLKHDSDGYRRRIESVSTAQKGLLLYTIAGFVHHTFGKADTAIRIYIDARKAGFTEPRLYDSMANAYHDTGDDRGAAGLLETEYLQRLADLTRPGTDRTARAYEREKNRMLDIASALIELNMNRLGNFSKGIEIFNQTEKNGIASYNRRFLSACADSAFWSGNEAFGNGYFAEAAEYYAIVPLLDEKSGAPGSISKRYDLERFIRILDRRKGLGTIRPEYIQKHTLLYLVKFRTHFTGPAGEVEVNNTYSEHGPRVKKSIINQNVMARMVEAFTGGKLSIRYDRRFLHESALAGFYEWESKKYGRVCSPEINAIIPEKEIISVMSASVADTDVYEIYWDKTGLPQGEFICFGGTTSNYPVIPYTLHIPRRGFMENDISRSASLRLVFHEYFHTVERVGRFKSQDDEANIISYFPEYAKSKSQLDYWDFMFSTKLVPMTGGDGKKIEGGWKAFSFSAQRPFSHDETKLKRLIALAQDIPSERRKKSRTIQKNAKEAEKAGRKDEAFSLYENAFEINPSFVNYYRIAARRASEKGEHGRAAELMGKYLMYEDNTREARWLGNLLIERLDRGDDAGRFYAEAYRIAAGKEVARISLDAGWRFYKKGSNDKALEYFEKGIAVEQCEEMRECRFLKGEILYKRGDIAEGLDLMNQAMERGLSSNKWYKARFEKLMKKR